MSEYLFIYGTLLPGYAPSEVAQVVAQLRPIGSAYIRGRLYDLGDYPGAILDESADALIFGEVFALPDDEKGLAALDGYEDFHPDDYPHSLFVRTKTRAALLDGRELECWVYVYNRTPRPASLIPSGDYATVKSKTRADVSTGR